jgi:hypothetical protein
MKLELDHVACICLDARRREGQGRIHPNLNHMDFDHPRLRLHRGDSTQEGRREEDGEMHRAVNVTVKIERTRECFSLINERRKGATSALANRRE